MSGLRELGGIGLEDSPYKRTVVSNLQRLFVDIEQQTRSSADPTNLNPPETSRQQRS